MGIVIEVRQKCKKKAQEVGKFEKLKSALKNAKDKREQSNV